MRLSACFSYMSCVARNLKRHLLFVVLAMLGICLVVFSGCSKEDKREQEDEDVQLFKKAKPYLETCQHLFDENGGKKTEGDKQWEESVAELLRLNPRVMVTIRGKVVLFEILNSFLDDNQAFIYIPQGEQIDKYFKEKVWLSRTPIMKKIQDNWYWIYYQG